MNGFSMNPTGMALASLMSKDLANQQAKNNAMLMGGLMGKSPVSVFVVKNSVDAVAAEEVTQTKLKRTIVARDGTIKAKGNIISKLVTAIYREHTNITEVRDNIKDLNLKPCLVAGEAEPGAAGGPQESAPVAAAGPGMISLAEARNVITLAVDSFTAALAEDPELTERISNLSTIIGDRLEKLS